MSDVSVLGAGLMGAALAKTLLVAGRSVTVWNRSPDKLRPLVDAGAQQADSVADLVAASPVLLVCISDYAATETVLGDPAVLPLLAGRIVVQCSSGTPQDAQDAAHVMLGRGAAYLDGAILGSPAGIGTSQATVLFSGNRSAFEAAAGLLNLLGHETVHYLGDTVGRAAALDLAWLTTIYGRIVSLAHAASICQAEDVDLNQLMSLIPEDPIAQSYLAIVRDGDFSAFTASLGVWAGALDKVRRKGADAGMDTTFPDAAYKIFEKAIAEGYAETHVMSLAKVMDTPI